MSDIQPTPKPLTAEEVSARLKAAFDQVAVCHCGCGMNDGCCDNHDPRWNPDEDSQLLSDAMHIIDASRAESAALRAAVAEAEKRAGFKDAEFETVIAEVKRSRDALAALEATGQPWCVMKCGEEEKGWTTAAYVARITDPEMEWAEATTLCLAASAAILAWAEAKGGK